LYAAHLDSHSFPTRRSSDLSVAGALLATILPDTVLHVLLPILLIGTAIYFLLKPDMDDVDRAQRMTPFVFGLTIVPLIGFYDGRSEEHTSELQSRENLVCRL